MPMTVRTYRLTGEGGMEALEQCNVTQNSRRIQVSEIVTNLLSVLAVESGPPGNYLDQTV